MAIHQLRINRVEYDDVKDTMTLVMLGDAPEAPSGVREDLWYPAPASFTVEIPVKKKQGTFQAPSGIFINPDTLQRYRITYTEAGWTEPEPVDVRGQKPKKEK